MSKRRKAAAAKTREVPPDHSEPLHPAFASLKELYRELERTRKAEQQRRVEQTRRQKQAQRDAHLFRQWAQDVIPLAPDNRVTLPATAPEPLPLQRWADDDAVLRESLSDDYGAEWLLETDETLSFRRNGIGPDVVRKLRRGAWTVTAQLDLHGLRVDEARTVIADFLRQCVRSDRRCVRIIHGKGLGSANRQPVLKEKVRRWLTQKEEVLAFTEARPHDGGSGVVIVLLKRPNLTTSPARTPLGSY